ncbi:MAG: hypothetical protein H0X37_18035 [Herpetosiphonaceae bacterium]|nr:hypothetical protein [Herpetosiphonaceae bacterium]
MRNNWWRLLQWLPAVSWVAIALRFPQILGISDPTPAHRLVDQLTSFCLLLLALSFARLHLSLRATMLTGSVLLLATGLLVLLPPSLSPLVAGIGLANLFLDYRYGHQQAAATAAGQALRVFLPYGLLHSLSQGPWPSGLALFVTLAATALALGAAIRALRSPDPRRAQSAALFGAAVAAVGLASPLAVVASCWTLLLLAVVGTNVSPLLQLPFPLTPTFIAWWLLIAAAAGSANWLLVGILVLAALCCGVATMRTTNRFTSLLPTDTPLLILLLVSSLLCGVGVRGLLPLADSLAIGLTQLGIVEAWPWLGVGGLNAAHQRVMVLPEVVWVGLGLVTLAISLILLPFRPSLPAEPPRTDDSDLWQLVEKRVWWLGHG